MLLYMTEGFKLTSYLELREVRSLSRVLTIWQRVNIYSTFNFILIDEHTHIHTHRY